MILLNKKEKETIKRQQKIIEEKNNKIKNLEFELKSFLSKEKEIQDKYSINLKRLDEIKNKIDFIADSSLNEKCNYFNESFKINIKKMCV